MSLKPEDKALIEAQRKNGRVMSLDDGVFICSAGGLAALLAAAREQPRQPPEDVREKVARIVEDAMAADEDCVARDASTPRYFAGKAADAILALPAVAVGDGWRPIETAPKDGTEFIAFRPDQGVFIARWAAMEEVVPRDQNGDPIEDYDDSFADWWHDSWGWLERELAPTHWQPKPAEPDAMIQAAPPHGGGG